MADNTSETPTDTVGRTTKGAVNSGIPAAGATATEVGRQAPAPEQKEGQKYKADKKSKYDEPLARRRMIQRTEKMPTKKRY